MTHNFLVVLAGTSVLGAAAGLIGTFAVLRRRALVGDALAHAALPGIVFAFLVLRDRSVPVLMVGAFASGLAGVLLISFLRRWTRIKEDAAIGIVLSVFFAVGIVLLRHAENIQAPGRAGLTEFMLGQTAGMVRSDAFLIAAVAALCLLAVVLLYKEFKLLSFDAAFGAVQGWPVLGMDLAMMALLTVVTIVGLSAVGVVMMAALIIVPAAAARFWTYRLGWMLTLAAVFGALAGALGTLVSFGALVWLFGPDFRPLGLNPLALPAGPVLVLFAIAIFVVSLLAAPYRGLVPEAYRRFALRRKTARQNLLRTLYELSEPHFPEPRWSTMADLREHRAWTGPSLRRLVAWAARKKLIETGPDGVRLSRQGLAEATALTRAHRLWELYLIEYAHIAPDHVDRDADTLEHLLPPDTLKTLEKRLTAAGRLPKAAQAAVPESPHEVTLAGKVKNEGQKTMNEG